MSKKFFLAATILLAVIFIFPACAASKVSETTMILGTWFNESDINEQEPICFYSDGALDISRAAERLAGDGTSTIFYSPAEWKYLSEEDVFRISSNNGKEQVYYYIEFIDNDTISITEKETGGERIWVRQAEPPIDIGADDNISGDIIVFDDENLEAAIRKRLDIWDRDITTADAESTTKLYIDCDEGINKIGTLKYFKNLTSLSLQFNQISDFSALSELTKLSFLCLNNSQISDISVLSGLTNLKDLGLSDNQINDISALSGLTNLTSLHLQNNQISNISALSGLTKLTTLFLDNNQISDISALSGLTNIGILNMSQNQISDISALSGLMNLIELSLGNNQISDISTLSGLELLRGLSMKNNEINDISALSGLVNLKHLSLADNPIEDFSPVSGYYDRLSYKDF